jgi:hypothetical protein
MYNTKALNSASEIGFNRPSFIIPQHIFKLVTKLFKFEQKTNLDKTLKLWSNSAKHDPDLKNIFLHFGWSEENKNFKKEIKYEELIKILEQTYGFNAEELLQDDNNMNNINSTNNIIINIKKEEELNYMNNNGNTSNNINSSNIQLINNSMNSNLSFSQMRNGNYILYNLYFILETDPLFQVQKPIAISNSQGMTQNLMFYENHYNYNEAFLTNSAKVWNQNSLQLV